MAVIPAVAEESFLSDVHLYTPFLQASKDNVAFTRFKIKEYSETKNHFVSKDMEKIHKDEEGDLSPPRKHAKQGDSDVITIEHCLSTPMKDVGLQVWRGALLLSDFLIHNEERFKKCIALELGAGLGLCSIVLGRVAKKVFCTDLRENILRCCQDNITANSHLFKYGYDVVSVRKFDWLASRLPTDEGDFCWTKEDQEVFKNVTVVLAADVIYDDSLTDAFIETFLRLMEANKQITLLLTIERRLNFTLEELAVTSPAYNYFLSRIKELETKEQRLSTRKLDIDFPNYLQYERVKQLKTDARKSLGTQTVKVTNEDLQHIKEAERKRAAHVEECEQGKRGKRSPSNDRKIKQSAQPANEQHVEGTYPPSLQPPSSEENVTEEHQASKVGQPAKDKNGVGTPPPLSFI